MKTVDVTKIMNDELWADRRACEQDILLCRVAQANGMTAHADGLTVQERIDVNRKCIETIDAELFRRLGEAPGAVINKGVRTKRRGKYKLCVECGGTGAVERDGSDQTCPVCKGSTVRP